MNVPISGKDFKTGQTLMKTVLAPMVKARQLGVSGWYSTNILGNRDGEVLDDPESFKTKEESKKGALDYIFQPHLYPDLYKDISHVVRINYYPPRGDNKEGWDNIDIVGWLGYPMQLKINFLCRDSILAAPIVLDVALFLDLAKRADGKLERVFGNQPDAYWALLSGTAGTPANASVANVAAHIRNIETFGKLQGAVLASVTDMGTYFVTTGFNNLSYWDALRNIGRAGGREAKDFMNAHGMIAESMISDLNRWTRYASPSLKWICRDSLPRLARAPLPGAGPCPGWRWRPKHRASPRCCSFIPSFLWSRSPVPTSHMRCP